MRDVDYTERNESSRIGARGVRALPLLTEAGRAGSPLPAVIRNKFFGAKYSAGTPRGDEISLTANTPGVRVPYHTMDPEAAPINELPWLGSKAKSVFPPVSKYGGFQ